MFIFELMLLTINYQNDYAFSTMKHAYLSHIHSYILLKSFDHKELGMLRGPALMSFSVL